MQSHLRVFGKFEDAKNSQYSDEDERAALLRRLAVASYVLQPTHRAATRRAAQRRTRSVSVNGTVMDMYSYRPMGASVARLVILVSGARSRSWN